MTTHDLKCHPMHFADTLSGVKTCEVRRDDRGYAVGGSRIERAAGSSPVEAIEAAMAAKGDGHADQS